MEALATSIARNALTSIWTSQNDHVLSATVKVAKPDALVSAECPEIQLTRTWANFQSSSQTPNQEGPSVAAIAFGSNVGDRFANIEAALRHLESSSVKIIDTSFLYESKAMYVENQRNFINGACLVNLATIWCSQR